MRRVTSPEMSAGLPGLRTANLPHDHGSRLESSSFGAMEDVNFMSFIRCGGGAGLPARKYQDKIIWPRRRLGQSLGGPNRGGSCYEYQS